MRLKTVKQIKKIIVLPVYAVLNCDQYLIKTNITQNVNKASQ